MNWGRRSRQLLVSCAVLAAAVLAVFGGVGSFGYVDYDDGVYVFSNPHIVQGDALDRIRWAFTTFHASNWHPVTWLSLIADHTLFESDPTWHHRETLALHLLSSVLLLLLVARLTGSVGTSVVVAVLFALHPLRVESVAWASERKGALAGFFWLTTMHAHVAFCRRPTPLRRLMTGVMASAAMLSKPTAVTLPLFLLLLDWWPLGRIGRSSGRALIAAVSEKMPLAALAATVTALTVLAQSRGGAVAPLAILPLTDRLASAAVSPWFLLWKTFWPSGLSPVYPHHVPSASLAAAGALGTVGLAMVAAWFRNSHPCLAFGWLGWLILLAPVSNLIQVGAQFTADRYAWLPHVPLLLAGATATARFLPARSAWRAAALAGALCGALALALAASRQTALWGDELALYSHAAAVTQRNWKMHYALGRSLSGRGREEEAIRQYELALEARPSYPEALNNLGRLYGGRGDVTIAMELFARAVFTDPNHATSWYNLGYLRESAGDAQGALSCYEKTVALDPGNPEGWGRRGIVLQQLGQTGEAVASCKEALRRDATSPAAQACIALVESHGSIPRAPLRPPADPAAP